MKTFKGARTCSIGGSGTWALDFPEALGHDVTDILHDIDTPFGPVPTVKVFEVAGHFVLRIPTHGWHFPVPTIDDTLALFWLLNEMGVNQVITDASVGGIRAAPGSIVIPDDVVITAQGRLAGAQLAATLGRNPWVRMKDPFCTHIREALEDASVNLNPSIGGTYYTTPLSVFETEAEVQSIHASGATVVGQVCGQEAICARLSEMCYGVINPVANWAEGLGEGDDWDMGNYYEEIAVPMVSIIWETLENVVGGHRSCPSVGVGIDTYTKGEQSA